ncbi:hypothetical protein [Vitiosangium sp. GDMCC 1.1324]|uniref:hypothetical protein n=1 Tax=Vitiosangium sp. (strain GDMCC 1.1324) TaxID=2138576 RepID=UPI000D336ADA|nr:hypothetical protein [Vitiosangium sp. GDMCC 1.1324]PTL84390.1 hypothetical protein DAT35_04655 [Vitiosangium sp. GDMCC 1.1324]
MLKSAMNDWALKAIQLETALMALDEVGLPSNMKGLQDKAEEALTELVRGWLAQKPKPDERKWKVEPAKEGGSPQDEELAEIVSSLKEDGEEWSVYRATSDKGDTVETVVSADRAWMTAGGDYYSGQWDEEAQQLDVGRDDEEGELGTGLILTLKGELVYESQLED